VNNRGQQSVFLSRKMTRKLKQQGEYHQLTFFYLKKAFAYSAFFCLLFATIQVHANHLKGGWIQYEYLGPGSTANSSSYSITIKQYLDCGSTAAQRDAQVYLGIFDGNTNLQFGATIAIPLSGTDHPNKTSFSTCLNNPPIGKVCYFIDRYTTTVDLPNNVGGYTLSVQRCCRISNIVNVGGNSSTIGVSYSNKIPGTINGVDYSKNSSPVFAQKDTVIVCFKTPFVFDFSATDKDADSLSYEFCDGIIGGNSSAGGAQPNPPAGPPYSSVPYAIGYSGTTPMGSNVSINSLTGLISGTAPSVSGDYIVAVWVKEYKNGVLIGTTRKEIHITVADCSLSAAALKPSYITCNGFTMNFQNESLNSNVSNYQWDFGETKFPATNVSIAATPTHTYSDTGVYQMKLVVTSSGGCKDSASAEVRVFPGFVPNFIVQGNCFINPYQFKDKTTTLYGVVNSWRWDFGDLTSVADTAISKDSAWTFSSAQTIQASLIVSNSKGCIDTITKSIIIPDKPSLNLAFKDTLICSIDTLQLRSLVGAGNIKWTVSNSLSKLRILNDTTAFPLVFPIDTTRYFVSINDNGCINTDTVTVNVLPFIAVDAGLDSVICKTDAFQLHTISQALSYQWRSSTAEVVANTKFPLVQPLTNTKYYVTANLGKCQARDSVFYRVAAYPVAAISADTVICYGARVQLQGFVVGSSFKWTPTSSLLNASTIQPIAGPTKTTSYILTANDTLGCAKAVSDTVIVTVIQPFKVNAGNDTSIVADQPVQLNATGAVNYQWSPATGLSDPNIANPIAVLDKSIDSILYTVIAYDLNGCSAKDAVKIRVYHSEPDILVPSAFTPDGDGKNDVIRPITIGITKLDYFSIYNRWGQQVFMTTELGKGWDGVFNGTKQAAGAYVYTTEGSDYLGKRISRKGTIVLIR
jgi:gliding motility-associated-like protein